MKSLELRRLEAINKMNIFKKQIQDYLILNKDRKIQDVYDELKNKKKLTNQEKMVYIYLKQNKRRLELK